MTISNEIHKKNKTNRVSREQVLNATLDLVLSDGVKAVSLRKIAAKVGCAAPTIYYYFSSKQEIIETLWTKQIDVVLEHSFVYTDLFDILYHYGSYWLVHRSLFQLMFLGEDVSVVELSSYAVLEKTIEAKFHERGCRIQWAARRTQITLAAIHGLVLSSKHRFIEPTEAGILLESSISFLLAD